MVRQFNLILFLLSSLLFSSYGQSTEVHYLSGTGYDNTVEWDFFCSSGLKSGSWEKINVPSQWEQEGFGEYTYGRWYMQKGKQPSAETGQYKTTFFAPKTWGNKVVSLVFEGVMTDTRVLINGEQVGEIHQGGFYRFHFDITDKIIPESENKLEVFVSKHSSDRSVNAAERMADWWLFGGIYRPVYLEIKPEEHISLLKVNPEFDGTFTGEVSLSGLQKDAILRCSIKNKNDKIYTSFDSPVTVANSTAIIKTKWDNILAWTPETPELYDLKLELIRKNKVLHSITERIGFRTIEVRPQDGIYCNGTKIILKGINRHTFWPESGRCTNKDISVMDVKLIKEMNMNAVRCHYPPDEHFLDACDSLGLFFIDELAGWQNPYSTSIGEKLVKEMIERDVNHPSVIIWSNGNEGGWNEDIDPLFEKLDPQKRDVIHPWADFDDIDTHHYPQYQTGVHRFNDGYKIFMPGEFLHGLYDEGHGAGLDDFWAKWTEHPLFAGGFLWAFSDCAIKRSDLPDTLDSDGQHAPDGVLGPYREKEGSFYTIREIWAPIQFKQIHINKSFTGEFLITNKYLFTNLNQCSMTYSVKTVPGPWDEAEKSEIITHGEIPIPDITPGETRKLKMNMPSNFFDGDVLTITAKDPFGKEIYTWTWPIRYAAQYLERKMEVPVTNKLAGFTKNEGKIVLQGSDTKISFSAQTGIIEKIETADGESPFSGGPVPVGMKAVVDHTVVRQEGGSAVFTVWYKGGIDSIRWEMFPDGKIKMSMLALNKATNDGGFDGGYIADKIELWGITFNFPEEQSTGISWFGKGPYRVWRNRLKGTGYDLWSKKYNNTITGESFKELIYPEYKGYHANTYWATISTKNEIPLTIASESDGLFLRLFTPEEPKGSLKPSLPVFPEGDLSFLYEINAMHAFKPVSQMGPQSEPNSIRIKKGDEGISMILWFDFSSKNLKKF